MQRLSGDPDTSSTQKKDAANEIPKQNNIAAMNDLLRTFNDKEKTAAIAAVAKANSELANSGSSWSFRVEPGNIGLRDGRPPSPDQPKIDAQILSKFQAKKEALLKNPPSLIKRTLEEIANKLTGGPSSSLPKIFAEHIEIAADGDGLYQLKINLDRVDRSLKENGLMIDREKLAKIVQSVDPTMEVDSGHIRFTLLTKFELGTVNINMVG